MTTPDPTAEPAVTGWASDLARLFESDPLGYNDLDTATVVKRMRENQAQFELGLRSPVGERKTKAVVKKNPTDTTKSPVDLLKDLGL